MQEALYPVPQGAASSATPSRLLIVKADPSPINPVPQRLQGKSQDVLTVRLPLLIPFKVPALPNLYPPVILQGKNQDPLTVRLPFLGQPPLPAGAALTSNAVIRGRPQDVLTVRSPLLFQPPLPGGYFNTKLMLTGRIPPDLPTVLASQLKTFQPVGPGPAPPGPTHHENVDLRRRYLLGIRRGGPLNSSQSRRRKL